MDGYKLKDFLVYFYDLCSFLPLQLKHALRRASYSSGSPPVESHVRTTTPPKQQRAAVLHSSDPVQSQRVTSRPAPLWAPRLQRQRRAAMPKRDTVCPLVPKPKAHLQVGTTSRVTEAPQRVCPLSRGNQPHPPPSLAKPPSAELVSAFCPADLLKSLV